MKRNNNIQQQEELTKKQNVILKLRLAMATHHYDLVESLSKEITTINKNLR